MLLHLSWRLLHWLLSACHRSFPGHVFKDDTMAAQPSRALAPSGAVNTRRDSIPRTLFCTVVSLLHARAYGGSSWLHGDDTGAVDGWFTGQQRVRAKVTVRPCPLLCSCVNMF